MVTRLSGGLTPADGADPRTFPAIWNSTATDVESLQASSVTFGTAITALQGSAVALGSAVDVIEAYNLDDLNDVTIGTAVADGQVLAYSTAVSGWVNEDAAAGGGKILQVLSTTKTDTFSASVSSGDFVAVTGLSVAITPTSASSTILILVSVVGSNSINTGASVIDFRLKRGGTAIGIGDASGSRPRLTSGGFALSNIAGGRLTQTGQFLDSPATTSSTTYSVDLYNPSGITETLYVNRTPDDSDAVGRPRMVSSITVMEVAG